MSLFDKFAPIEEIRSNLAQLGTLPFGVVTEKILSPTQGIINGKQVLLAGTNNYLGLTFDPDCITAAKQALDQQGTGTTGSRMANGTFTDHTLLEQDLAEFYGVNHAIIFTTGTAATTGMAATLAGPGDVILMDADSHASIYDGVRLSGAEIIRFRHNDPADLEKKLRRLGKRASNALIIVEGIYSMLGDQAPLAEIAALKKQYGGYLMVDEAHSLGVLGDQGRGAAEATGVESDVDFIVGTFSKSLGATGGFCVSRHPELECLRMAIRTYIFTASPPPSVIASTRMALRKLKNQPVLRQRLWANARRLHEGLRSLGLAVSSEVSPVTAVRIDDSEAAIRGWHRLLDAGIFVNLVIPPASPGTYSLLRCSVSAAHSTAEIDQIIAGFGELSAIPSPLSETATPC